MIRKVDKNDFAQIVQILRDVQNSGNSYFFENMSDEQLLDYWIKPGFTCFVAQENDHILGSYILGAIAEGRFSHTANASYIVSKNARGKGIGKKLAQHSVEFAKNCGFKAIQFQRVVSTNFAAVETWKKAGFNIIGTIPKAFRHKDLGFVDAYIFHREL